jgi:peptidoglycan/LPS O-acetylase OafA/YrhL
MNPRRAAHLLAWPVLASVALHADQVAPATPRSYTHVYAGIMVAVFGSVSVALVLRRWAAGRMDRVDALLSAIPGLALLAIATLVIFPDDVVGGLPVLALGGAACLVASVVRARRERSRL